jgi:hypothetical protein
MADTKPGIPQGGPPPGRTSLRRVATERGHRRSQDYDELANICEDSGFELDLHLPGAKGKIAPSVGDQVVRITIFACDRGYVFSDSVDHIGRLESLAIEALAKLRAMGLVT